MSVADKVSLEIKFYESKRNIVIFCVGFSYSPQKMT